MKLPNFIIFYTIIGIVQFMLDFYFFRSWQNFVKKNNFHKLFYQIPWIFSGLMIILSFSLMYNRLFNPAFTDFTYWAFALVSVWFLPKFVIVPFLFFKDISNFIVSSSSKFFKSKDKIPQENEQSKFSRREAIKAGGWALSTVPFIVAGNGVLNTLYDFQTENIELKLKNLPKSLDGIKILQISDIHSGSFLDHKPIEEVLRITNEAKADIICMTGDFVNFNPKELKTTYRTLEKFKADLGVYGCLGNHDHYMNNEDHLLLFNSLTNAKIKMLNNENKILNINGTKLNLAGTDNYGMNQHFGDFKQALYGLDGEYPTILLCHDPRNWDLFIKNKENVDLMLAGHTHGGQVAFEIAGLNFEPVKYVYKQYAGLYSENEQHLYINRGIGTTGPPIRIGVNPEITVITLRS